jgi:class 3 adenylate cyclase
MQPRIEYATTADGVSIAYTAMGEGIPLVNPPPALPWSNVQEEWEIPEWRHYYEHLGEIFRVIRYDNRGSGLSSRSFPGEINLESHLLDLEAVVERLGLERFALYGLYFNAQIAIAYAARHPEQVSHLILWCAVPSPEENARPAALQEALNTLVDLDYGLFTETLAHTVFGWDSGEAAHRLALYMQSSMDEATFRACWRGGEDETDVRPLLSKVQAPTLVIHKRDFKLLDIETSKRIAATIPNAHLTVLPGESLSPYMGDIRAALDAYAEFVGVNPVEYRDSTQHRHEGEAKLAAFHTIMFTDMEESTAMTQRLGDERAQSMVRHHDLIVGSALFARNGRQVKHTGDGIMAAFPTASAALECAISIQRAFAEHNAMNADEQVNVRIGINAGEPVAEGDDLFGTAVQLASRVCQQAVPGEILTTDVVRQLVAGKDFLFADKGSAALRGFEDPVRVFEVRWHHDGA